MRVWSSHILLLLSISTLIAAIVFDTQFVEKWIVTDGDMDLRNEFYLVVLRVIACFLSFSIFLMYILSEDIKNEYAKFKAYMKDGSNIEITSLITPIDNRSLNVFLYLFLTIWLAFILYSLFVNPNLASSLIHENGFFQSLTVILYLISACFIGRKIFLVKELKSFFTVWMACLLFFFLFVAGEEISWGQQYLKFNTPKILEEANVQGEFGLHNIPFPGLYDYFINDLARLVAFFLGVLLPLTLLFSSRIRMVFAYLQILASPIISILFFICAFGIPSDTFIPEILDETGYPIVKANVESELRELTISFAFSLWAYSILKSRRPAIVGSKRRFDDWESEQEHA